MEAQQATFRDRPQNIDESGNKKKINVRQPKGKWYKRRSIVGYSLLAFLIIAPFIKINGNPFMLFDITHRKFYIFSHVFMPQETYILALIMAVAVVSIVLFTVAFGRIFCGWACPQTLFLELVFRRIEFLFDGNQRSKAYKPATGAKKYVKHAVFIAISIFFTNAFLNWFTGPEKLFAIISDPISAHFGGFVIMLGISLFYYWIYTHFREQVCTHICPYGRMQGVLIDSKTITVAYDYKRGEPRGKNNQGDCIDCGRCISVCPTGIDIKNGSQLECVNCTACIDECNSVMTRINKPINLIGYKSAYQIETGKKSILNARTIAYSFVLAALFSVLIVVIAKKTEVHSTMMRLQGTMYQQIDAQTISNVYNFKIANKTHETKQVDLKILQPKEGELQVMGKALIIEPYSVLESVVMVRLKGSQLVGKSTPLKVGVYDGDELLETIEANFLGPN